MKTRWSPTRTMELTFLTLALFFASAAGIKVKFGTNDGPIVPPPPSTPRPPPPLPYRNPAPVWEDNVDDIPNPNPYKAPVIPYLQHWLNNKGSTASPSTPKPTQAQTTVHSTFAPPSQKPQTGQNTRFTHIVFNKPAQAAPAPPSSSTLSPAKAFVNAYAQPTKPTPTPTATTQQYSTPTRAPEENYQRIDSVGQYDFSRQVPVIGVRYIPGFGYKYFTPELDRPDPRRDYRYNTLDSNDISGHHPHQNDIDLSYDKYLAQRVKKSPTDQTYVPQQFTYYHQQQPQLFFPAPLYPSH